MLGVGNHVVHVGDTLGHHVSVVGVVLGSSGGHVG